MKDLIFSFHCGFWGLNLSVQVCVTSAFTFWAISIVPSVKLSQGAYAKLTWNLVTVYIHSDLEHTGDKCIHSHVSRRKSPNSLGCLPGSLTLCRGHPNAALPPGHLATGELSSQAVVIFGQSVP